MSFSYRGRVPSSKSMLNRLLILQSFEPSVSVVIDSTADDVMKMRSALASLERGEPADCGAAGTTLRFLALRAARIPGRHRLTGTERLFERPQAELLRLLTQLGCRVTFEAQALLIEGEGWNPLAPVEIDQSVSSQFASALLLSAWGLERALAINLTAEGLSAGYLAMTLALVRSAGMSVIREGSTLTVARRALMAATNLAAEPDLSSAFALAAVALARRGEAKFEEWPKDSLQPDSVFPYLLGKMGCTISREGGSLTLSAAEVTRPKSVNFDMGNCPDLFPVLGVLCAFAEGESLLHGAPHLVHKESDRVEKIAELLRAMGAEAVPVPGGLKIKPRQNTPLPLTFDPAHDHRLAMAASVAKAAGFPIELLFPEVVNKSFPGFWAALAASER
jgi:3-phosphoshikimate 1-carboxyvinyltransferase